ncbi:uncharacterized protein CC84DRAFT_1264102 [Paraphaeosphaeria sporulosa]|uniref:Uncharacterized protein n=1 Tax=Paraphaeosphaeria sporulosa TaxID=1460663 RepID=A0A177BWQ1_9PLEO|nr:uncharacterized protein CC84DRAFT_1264102 [Paraphaeosphaeria sporulosa]OAF99734.1 hypothetical protein CC84DRAFT_1264102 [Paraphaeosphaeria sporulosa]
MPLTLSLAAPGSHCRFLRCTTRLPHVSQLQLYVPNSRASTQARLQCLDTLRHYPHASFTTHQRPQSGLTGSQLYTPPQDTEGRSRSHAPANGSPEFNIGDWASILSTQMSEGFAQAAEKEGENVTGDSAGSTHGPSRRTRKRQRSSQPAMVLDHIYDGSRNLYCSSLESVDSLKHDHSYVNPAIRQHGGILRVVHPPENIRSPMDGPVSLYTILARQLSGLTMPPRTKTPFTRQEIMLLQSKGYSEADVHSWCQCLIDPSSDHASAVFSHHHCRTPLFLLLLFLRRKRIRTSALGRVMRHLGVRLRAEPIVWSSLTVLIIRLLRHARLVWPEAMPWITSLFCTEATRLYREGKEADSSSSTFQAVLTRFCNSLLVLISLPTSEHPMIAGSYQEKAQFVVLQFMASCEPALIVTRHGFRGAIRTQLTHPKTTKEKEWGMLKGPSWPPWKENRNAMDEDKGYMFGASRASRLLHRLFEAGYAGREWEKIAEVYAGWDTDLSPTVQTRTHMPPDNNAHGSENKARLWGARIRTTRTRREAWACFLAYEESGTGASSLVYQAMFEKLHYPEITAQQSGHGDPSSSEFIASNAKNPLPGDMKEVLSDPTSPLHLVYLSEPVPSYIQLYERMWRNRLRPKKRLLAFLLETLPDFETCLHLLEATQGRFGGGVSRLLHGIPLDKRDRALIPNFFMTSFIRCLCRFGRFGDSPPDEPLRIARAYHEERLKHDRTYLIEYAYHLLMTLQLTYRPPWTAYMQKLLYGYGKQKSAASQYTAMCKIFDRMTQKDVGPDDDQFKLLCTVVRYTARTIYNGRLPAELANRILPSARSLLRTTFHNLVGANVDSSVVRPSGFEMETLPPHAPGPDVLQAYVRALGFLRDYEGLYSFSIWLTTYHKEIMVRANAQHGGPQLLYNTLVALRAALEGELDSSQIHDGAPEEIAELVKAQVNGVKEWKWPSEKHVKSYVVGRLTEEDRKSVLS